MGRVSYILLALGSILVLAAEPAYARGRIFGRGRHSGCGSACYTYSRPVAPPPAAAPGIVLSKVPPAAETTDGVTELIAGKYYRVKYEIGALGLPIAKVTHVWNQGRFVEIQPDEAIAKTGQIVRKFSDGKIYSFVFEGQTGQAYAELARVAGGDPSWIKYEKRTEDERIGESPELDYRAPSKYEYERVSSKGVADRLEKELAAERNSPGVQHRIANANSSAAFQRFYQSWAPYLQTKLPPKDILLARTGLPQSPWGSHTAVTPVDPNRPGVLITADEEHFQEVDDVVTSLRTATTGALIRRRAPRSKLEGLRANSIIIARTGTKLDDAIRDTNRQLSQVPAVAAARAVMQAEAITGHGFFASASRRVERAARGGLGARRFNSGLSQGLGTAVSGAQQSLDKVVQVIAHRARETAFEGAVKMANRAQEVGKKAELLGFELDFTNQRGLGVDYYVKTVEGKIYYLRNLGKNFAGGDFIPKTVYGGFNVSVLELYEKTKSITESDLLALAEKYHLLPVGNELRYQPPASTE